MFWIDFRDQEKYFVLLETEMRKRNNFHNVFQEIYENTK